MSSCADNESALYVLYQHTISWLPSMVSLTNGYTPSYLSRCRSKCSLLVLYNKTLQIGKADLVYKGGISNLNEILTGYKLLDILTFLQIQIQC